MHRRNFIKNTGLTAAGLTIINFPIFGKNAPSNKVVIGIMGVNSRGAYHAANFSKLPNVEIAYLCDVEDKAIKNGLDALKNVSRKPTIVKDIRKMVTMNDLDGFTIAAPDHWHAPAALLGVSNGKHVYVEKPCSHNPHESEMLIEAQKKYGKIIQVGSQRRSFTSLMDAVKNVREGIIGNVYLGKAWYVRNRPSIGIGKVVPVPSTLDYELWQGPAVRKDYKDNLVHYNWHWLWNYGTGEACNNGNHEIDCCRWFLDVDYPTKVTSSGGRYAFTDDWETPDTQIASFEFGDKKAITWEGRSCSNAPVEGSDRGFIIYGTKGWLLNKGGGDYKIYDLSNKLIKESKPDTAPAADVTNTVSSTGDKDIVHFSNFIESIRGNATPNAPILEGHKSVILCHLANIAQRTGSTLHTDPTNGHIKDNKAAMHLWKREYNKAFEMKLS
ncbi:MAG: Gfo/Idh/MocA family oxidoreductase [Pedobacter sp.]|nr:Gfo/Idh/MocA family oxidoreductase [Chitinophagaceae bacterium]